MTSVGTFGMALGYVVTGVIGEGPESEAMVHFSATGAPYAWITSHTGKMMVFGNDPEDDEQTFGFINLAHLTPMRLHS